MTTDTIFSTEGTTNTSGTTPATTKDEGLFAALVGEKQKYKSPDELAKAYANADSFIEQLKEENRKLRETAAQAKTIDEVLERISKANEGKKDDTPSQMDAASITSLVEQTLTGREAAKVKEANLLQADKLMKEKYGDKAAEVFKAKAVTPDLQKVFMELAARSPSDFVALFTSGAPASGGTMDTTKTNTTTMNFSSGDRSGVEWSKEWVAKVRKEQPSLYWSSDFQARFQKAVVDNPTLYFGDK